MAGKRKAAGGKRKRGRKLPARVRERAQRAKSGKARRDGRGRFV